jgi:hypothetical protein
MLVTNPLPIVIPNTYPIVFQIPIPTIVTRAHATNLPPRISKCFGVNLSFHIAPITTEISMDQTSIILIPNPGFYHPTYGPNLPILGSMTNPWLMMPSPYYIVHSSYVPPYPSTSIKLSFPNPIPTINTMMRGSEGAKTLALSPHVLPFTNGFPTKDQVPFSQPLVANAPLGSGHTRSGVQMGGGRGHLMLQN